MSDSSIDNSLILSALPPAEREQLLQGGHSQHYPSGAIIFSRGDEGDWALNLELVYGHAWGVGPRAAGGEFHVDAGAIGRRSRT